MNIVTSDATDEQPNSCTFFTFVETASIAKNIVVSDDMGLEFNDLAFAGRNTTWRRQSTSYRGLVSSVSLRTYLSPEVLLILFSLDLKLLLDANILLYSSPCFFFSFFTFSNCFQCRTEQKSPVRGFYILETYTVQAIHRSCISIVLKN